METLSGLLQLLWVEERLKQDAALEKITLMLFATPGMIAPAAMATKPAMREHSTRSWPFV
jgi:hypothetical protein